MKQAVYIVNISRFQSKKTDDTVVLNNIVSFDSYIKARRYIQKYAAQYDTIAQIRRKIMPVKAIKHILNKGSFSNTLYIATFTVKINDTKLPLINGNEVFFSIGIIYPN